MTRAEVYAQIDAERARQDAKWGEQRHPDVDRELCERPASGAFPGGCRPHRMADEYGIPSAPDAKTNCDVAARAGRPTWAHIAVEELAEVVEAATLAQQGKGPEEDVDKELVQLAAVIVQWIEARAARDQLAAVTRDATETEAELRITQNFAGRHMGVIAEERDAALAAVDAVRAVQRSLSDEQLSAIRADAAEWVVPHDSCFGCLFDADRRDEGITAYVCSECRAPYCEEHRDCDKHDYSNERCGCDGKPVPWEPWSNNVERLAMAEELIAMRALVRGGDRG